MELTKLVAKPQLIEVVIDNEHIVEEYGEAITFYTWDRLPLESYMSLVDDSDKSMLEQVKPFMLDKDGNEILVNGMTLPGPVLTQAIHKIIEKLGK